MLYTEYINKARDLVLEIEDDGKMYLRPDYRHVLHLEGLDINEVTDFDGVTMDIVSEQLKLYRDNYNVKNNKFNDIIEWIADIVTTQIEPAIQQENSELMNSVIEYMTLKDNLKEKEKEIDTKEKNINTKQQVAASFPGINFSKKRPN